MILSESARVTTAHEASFRIQYPNSKPRAVKVIALDAGSAKLVDEIAKLNWHGAAFFTSLSFDAGSAPGGTDGKTLKAWLNDLAGRTMDLVSEVAGADCVVVVATAGKDVQSAAVIAEVCTLHHKTLIALVVPEDNAPDDQIDVSLRALRPYAKMLVIAHGRDYIEAMLTALRA
ncbi:MAG: 3-methyl-2-oxobutanoate hydroxymethyltransferase [Hyphomicrobiales bacterium]|nr:3-methyl-2-oxobutanoate hydroxymethyltransferase [Hyphomicrobiales bacterium]